jgi:hypothetical protein
MRYETEKLIRTFSEHRKIIIGLDFDDTIFPLTISEYIEERCARVQSLIKSFKKEDIVLCIYTVSDNSSLKYKEFILHSLDINFDYVNRSPVIIGNGDKPFFNILLDDKAGLNESIEILTEFKKEIYK